MDSPTAAFLVLFLSLPPVFALPLRDPSFSPPSFQLLPFLIALLPLPILAALKYFYLRFRRGQSIHAVPHSLPSHPSPFYLALNPYLIGLFGSPHWETTISCRIHASFPLPLPNPPPIPPFFHPHSSQSDKSTANTTLVSSLSRKSRSIPFLLSCSSLPLTPLRSSAPSHPLVPPSIHVSSSLSPTLMQIMAPVLNSSYDLSSLIPPNPLRPPNDHSNPISLPTTHSSLFFGTSLNVSPTPTVPFIFLPKQLPPSPTPSIHSIPPSPASLSLAVFHSPLASRIPVPKPVYTPSLRPESCVVLPHDWPTSQEIALLDSAVLNPPTDGPLPPRSTVSNALDPRLKPTRPLAILKSPRSLAGSPSPLDGSLASPRSSPLISQRSPCMTPSPALSFLRVSQCEEWDLADLQDLNGRLDVDAISRVLGLGLGLGLPVADSVNNHDLDESEHASSSHSGSAAESENEGASDFDLPFDEQPNSAGSIKSPGWDHREGDLATFLGISLQMHVHGQPLSVIPEETSSEMGSSVGEDDDDLLAGLGTSVADSYDEKAGVEDTICNARSASFVWDGSWREGESIARLSVGVAC
ncbi:hypothetical protein GSI_09446 [Ganoderma sinense ZZ0214-1]|uniref:Transporter n=1 Tax=Ganoderma sinense ZZ0214-1 TaxID=1077348 RepID=A0A2G8S6M9_9APHY|nr:hypothetical protein GSI_09446 [Ganoderma sinense ZZ0214-1]